jgi:hypothetical protein
LFADVCEVDTHIFGVEFKENGLSILDLPFKPVAIKTQTLP